MLRILSSVLLVVLSGCGAVRPQAAPDAVEPDTVAELVEVLSAVFRDSSSISRPLLDVSSIEALGHSPTLSDAVVERLRASGVIRARCDLLRDRSGCHSATASWVAIVGTLQRKDPDRLSVEVFYSALAAEADSCTWPRRVEG